MAKDKLEDIFIKDENLNLDDETIEMLQTNSARTKNQVLEMKTLIVLDSETSEVYVAESYWRDQSELDIDDALSYIYTETGVTLKEQNCQWMLVDNLSVNIISGQINVIHNSHS